MSNTKIPREWTKATELANSDRELQKKLDDKCRVKNVRGEIGSVVDTEMEDDTVKVRFSDDDIGPIAISTIELVRRRSDHSGREPDDTGSAETVLQNALGVDEL